MSQKLWHRLDLHYPDPKEMAAETIYVTFKKVGEPLLFKSNGTGWYGEHGALASLTLGTAKAYWCKYDDFLNSFDDVPPTPSEPVRPLKPETKQLWKRLDVEYPEAKVLKLETIYVVNLGDAVCQVVSNGYSWVDPYEIRNGELPRTPICLADKYTHWCLKSDFVCALPGAPKITPEVAKPEQGKHKMHYKIWHKIAQHYPNPKEMASETIYVTFDKGGEPTKFKSNGTGWYGTHGELSSLTLSAADAYWCRYEDFLDSFDDGLPKETPSAETKQLVRGLSAVLNASGFVGKKSNVTADCTAAVKTLIVELKRLGVKFHVNVVITGTDSFSTLHVANMFVTKWQGPDPDVITQMMHVVKS